MSSDAFRYDGDDTREGRIRMESAYVATFAQLLNIGLIRRYFDHRELARQRQEGRARPGIPTTLDDVGHGTFEVARMLYHSEQYCRSTTRLH